MQPLLPGFVLLFTITIAEGSPVYKSGLKRDHCTWGAQYWCSSPKTAVLCKKTDWCTANVWSYDISEDVPCVITQKLVKFFRNTIASSDSESKTEYDVALKIAKGCSLFTDSTERQQCKAIATQQDSLMKLIQLVDSSLPPKAVAIAVGTCKRNLPKQSCTKCHDVVSTAQTYIRKFYTGEVHKKVFEVPCAKLKQGKTVCLALAEFQYKKFYEGLLKAIPENVCKRFTECFTSPLHEIEQTSDICSTCKNVVADIRALDRSSEVQGVIRTLVKSVCTELGPFEQMCDVLADEGLQYLFELIATEMEPDVLCEKIDLCRQSEKTKEPIFKAVSNEIVTIPKVKTSVPCIICQIVLNEVENFLQKNSTEKTLEQFVGEICNRLPPTVSDQCNTFVNQYAPIIIKLLESKVQPDVLCYTLTLCKNNSSTKTKFSSKPSNNFQPKDELCNLCEYVVTYIETFLEKNATQEEVEAMLEKVCVILPADLKPKCDNIVKTYAPVIIALLLQDLDPTSVCKDIGLCPQNKALPPVQQNLKIQKKVKGPTCALCEFVIQELDNLLAGNYSQAKIEAALEKVCNILPSSLTTECKNLVATYGPLIIQLLLQEVQPQQLCTAIRLCSGQTVSKPVTAQIKGELCDMCKYVVTYIDTYLQKNNTQDEIEALLDKVCKILPSSLSSECDQIVQQYGPVIIQLLIKELDPSQICTLIGLCANNKALPPVEQNLKIQKKVKGPTCALCEFVIQELDNLLAGNYSQAKIEAALEKVCNLLPSSLTTECKNLVATYGPLIIQLLLQEVQPQQLCTAIRLCSGQTVSKPVTAQIKGELCDMCKYVVTYIDTYLQKNNTQDEIEALLDKVCKILPSSLSSECDQIVQQYGPVIIQLLIKELNPSQICTLIGLCANNKALPPVQQNLKIQKKVKGPTCALCEFVIQELDNLLAGNYSQAKIEAALEKVCNILPSSLTTECKNLVATYGPLIIQLLLQEVQPQQLCTAIRLCSGQTVSKPVTAQIKGELCDMCKYVVTYIDTYLQKNNTQDEIEALLDKVCKILPSSLSSECDQIVQQYGPVIIQLLIKELDPSQICTLIGLCANNKDSRPNTLQINVSGPSCALCEFIMKELNTLLSENKTEAEIEAKLDAVCDRLPSTIKTECETMVQQYAPIIIKMLINKIDPQKICTFLGLCNNTLTTLPSAVKIYNSPMCVLCEFIMKELDGILAENKSEAQIQAALRAVCDLLPDTLNPECLQFVDNYGPLIIQMLIDRMQPDQVCQVIKLCTKTSIISAPVLSNTGGPLCALCEYIIQALDTILEKNSTQAKIENALNKVCNYLPTSLTSECQQFVDQYGPLIITVFLQDLQPQQICTALKFCTNSTLKRYSMKLSSPSCAVCEFIMQELSSLLSENKTEAEIEAKLDAVCDRLPSTINTECENMVQQYAPIIIKMLINKIDPQKICTFLGLCNQTLTHLSPPVKIYNSPICVLCEFIMKELDELLAQNKSEAWIQAALQEVCKELPDTLKPECQQFVINYGPLIIQMLIDRLQPDQICQVIKLCTKSSQKFVPVIGETGGPLCAICEYIIQALDTILEKNSTQAKIDGALKQVCNYLPTSLTSECQQFVDQYGQEIINLLLQEMKPQEICTALRLCTNSKPKKLSIKLSGPSCAMCEFMMTELVTLLDENSTETQIQAKLEEVCNLLPETLKSECESIVEQYSTIIIHIIASKIDPQKVCSILGFCKGSDKVLISPKPSVRKGELCDLCTLVFNALESLITTKASKQEILAALDKVCSLLPPNLKEQCESFVGLYLPYVVDLIVQELTPEKICEKLELCASKLETAPKLHISQETSVVVKKDELCAVCIYVFEAVYKLISDNKSIPEIENALDKVCDLLVPLKDQCENLVALYTPYAVDLILKELTPQMICNEFRLCSNSTHAVINPQAKSDVKCAICEFVLKYLELLIAKNTSEQEIESALKNVCNILPVEVKKDCVSFVATYTPLLLSLLSSFPPDQVCDMVKACTPPPKASTESKKIKNGPMCPICENIMKELEDLLSKNASEQEIVAALEKVCNILPSSLKQECDSFIEDYTPILINLLLKMSPDQVCSYLKFCTNTTKESNQLKNGPMCPICEFVMNELEDLLSKNASEQEIIAALEKVCNILPSTLKQECDSFIEDYAPVLIQMLIHMSPDQVCSYLKFCTNTTKESNQLKNGPMCPICEFIMNELEKLLSKNASEQEIVAALEKVCNFLPDTVRKECDSYVEAYTPILINLLLKMSPDQVCSYLKFCTNTTKESNQLKNGPMCPICEFVMNELEDLLSKNASEQEIIAALEKVCNILPSTLKQECDSFIEDYAPVLIQMLIHMSPDQVCSYLKFCTNTTKESNQLKNGPMCPICEFIMNELEKLLSKNASEQEIVAALEKVCNFLPDTVRKECDSYVEAYTPILINLLLKMSPDQVCSYLKFCTNTTKESNQLKNGPMCPICEFVMNELEDLLSKNASEQEIIAALEKVCNILPSTLKQECDNFIEDYAPVLIQMLIHMSPDQVCSYLKFCTNTTKESNQLKNGPMCPICEFIMNELEKLLSKNASEQEIVAALEKVCNFLPDTVRKECDSYVEAYTPILINLLLKMSPDQVCSYLKFCTNTTKESNQLKNGPMCPICEFVMNELEDLLSKNASEQEIIAALEKVCNILPSTLKQECDSFIEDYAPVLIQMLIHMSPDQVCSYLKFCTNTTKESNQLKNGPMCPICEFIMNELEKLLSKNASEQEIVAALEKVCNFLPDTVRKECDSYVEAYTPILINLLLKMSPDQVCSYLKFCTNTTKESNQLKNGPMCPICEFVMNELEDLLSKNASEQEIIAALEKVCNILPSTLKQECDSFIEDYAPVLIQLLIHMSPDQVCTYLKFCTNTTKAVVQSLPTSSYCVLCELILEKLDGFLSKNLTQNELEKALDMVCFLLPRTLEKGCEKFVSQYEPVLMKLLLQEMRPRQVCIAANICPNKVSQAASNSLTFKSEKKDPPSTTPVFMEHCSECKFAFYEVQTALADPYWLTKAKSISSEVCKLLKSGQDDCASLLESNYAAVVNNVVAFRFPIEFCQKINLCEVPPLITSGQSNHKELTLNIGKDDPAATPAYKEHCSECKLALFNLQTALGDPFWQVEFKASLEVLCTYFKNGQDTCNSLVQENFDNLLDQIRSYDFPISFCKKIDYCEYPSPELTSSVKGVECEVCKVLIQLLDISLQANKTVTEVEKVLYAACDSIIPAPERPQCESMVRNYTPAFLQLLSQLDDPTKVCQATKLCPKNKTQPLKKLLGNKH